MPQHLLQCCREGVIEELIKTKELQKENKALLANEYHDYDLVVAKVNGMPHELRTIDKMFYKLIEEKSLRPVVFHSLRHSSTSLKLKLSKGNIKAVQGDTGRTEVRMVTDTYAYSFDEDRNLIAQSDISKLENRNSNPTLGMLKRLAEEMNMTVRLEFVPKRVD